MNVRFIMITLMLLTLNIFLNSADWIPSGSHIYYNAGNVAIGTNVPSPIAKLYINDGPILITDDSLCAVGLFNTSTAYKNMNFILINNNGKFSIEKRNGANLVATPFAVDWATGFVTINGKNPVRSLQVGGGIRVKGGLPVMGRDINDCGLSFDNSGGSDVTGIYSISEGEINIYNKDLQAVIIKSGNVGIGIANPVEKLEVDGTIRAKRVRVQTLNWSDFVFDKGYELKSLTEVERFIRSNGHLPQIPSAKEVIKNGIDTAEMDAKLLQKIEELTLYLIRMDKENSLMKQENRALKEKLLKLEEALQ